MEAHTTKFQRPRRNIPPKLNKSCHRNHHRRVVEEEAICQFLEACTQSSGISSSKRIVSDEWQIKQRSVPTGMKSRVSAGYPSMIYWTRKDGRDTSHEIVGGAVLLRTLHASAHATLPSNPGVLKLLRATHLWNFVARTKMAENESLDASHCHPYAN